MYQLWVAALPLSLESLVGELWNQMCQCLWLLLLLFHLLGILHQPYKASCGRKDNRLISDLSLEQKSKTVVQSEIIPSDRINNLDI